MYALDKFGIKENDRKKLHPFIGSPLTYSFQNFYGFAEEESKQPVAITEEQLLHIRNRHPEEYKETINYIREILDNPDYILRDKHPNTGLVIKRILATDESSLIVYKKE